MLEIVNTLLQPLGFVLLRKDDEFLDDVQKMQLELKVEGFEQELKKKDGEIKKLHLEIKEKEIIDIDIADPAPVDQKSRRIYVSEVAGFHRSYLRTKLVQMISSAHSLLEENDNDRDVDLVLKGAIYSFRELIRWGDKMVNESLEYTSGGGSNDNN